MRVPRRSSASIGAAAEPSVPLPLMLPFPLMLMLLSALSVLSACSLGLDDSVESTDGNESATEFGEAIDSESVQSEDEPSPDDTTASTEPDSSTTATTATTSTETSEPAEPSSKMAIYVTSFDPTGGSDLYRFDGDQFAPVTALSGPAGPIQITDIAWSDGGVLYGSTFDELVTINTVTGEVNVIGLFPVGQVNALAFLGDGRLIAADLDGVVSVIDVETAAAETLTSYPQGLTSSGDLAITGDGTIYATATDGVSEHLLVIDAATGAVETRSSLLPAAVYGLVPTPDGNLIGLTYESASGRCVFGEMIELAASGDRYEPLACLDFAPGGAAGG